VLPSAPHLTIERALDVGRGALAGGALALGWIALEQRQPLMARVVARP
jgi:hypothetical protein